MIVSLPPFTVYKQVVRRLSERPGFAHEWSDAAANGEIDPLNERGLNIFAEPLVSEQLIEGLAGAPEHSRNCKGKPIAALALDELAVEEIVVDLPVVGAGAFRAEPATKMGSDSVEVAAEAVACEGRDAVVVQA